MYGDQFGEFVCVFCNDIVTRIIVTHITCDKSSLDLRSMLSYTFIPDVFACAP